MSLQNTAEESLTHSASPGLSSSPSIEKSDDENNMISIGDFLIEEKNKAMRTASAGSRNVPKGAVKKPEPLSPPTANGMSQTPNAMSPANANMNPNAQPAYMGDILDDIFGGSFRTPGVKASEDILLAKTITPALAFEELENIRASPTLFMLFYSDAEERKVLESLHFILEVEEFVALPLDFRMGRESEIIDNYLTIGAVTEINIPDNTRRIVNEKKGTKCEDIFTEVQKYITHMLIRNVDSTWNYKKIPIPHPKKELKGKYIKKAIDKATPDQRMRDLIYYFLARRITPLMYQARTSVVSLQRKVRTSAPIGWAIVKIKQINGFAPKSNSAITVYIIAQCYYQNQAGILRDKKSLLKSTMKKGVNEFKWEEELKFDVKEIETQAIELCIWEKRFLPDNVLATFCIEFANLIETKEQETFSEVKITLDDGMGEILIDFAYKPNQEELLRLQQEREKREQQSRTAGVSPEFDFLLG